MPRREREAKGDKQEKIATPVFFFFFFGEVYFSKGIIYDGNVNGANCIMTFFFFSLSIYSEDDDGGDTHIRMLKRRVPSCFKIM